MIYIQLYSHGGRLSTRITSASLQVRNPPPSLPLPRALYIVSVNTSSLLMGVEALA